MPITGLPIVQKLVLRSWMLLASPWLELRRPSSHGFRSGFQSAEAHLIILSILDRRADWGLETVVAKLDTAKAYDSVRHEAFHRCFPQRAVPPQ